MAAKSAPRKQPLDKEYSCYKRSLAEGKIENLQRQNALDTCNCCISPVKFVERGDSLQHAPYEFRPIQVARTD